MESSDNHTRDGGAETLSCAWQVGPLIAQGLFDVITSRVFPETQTKDPQPR